jgi:glutathione synthase/RimK-type ligase-like ATP-grasp enzyme
MGSYQIVRSKMEKTRVLLTDAKLARYVPKTQLFDDENLKAIVGEHNQVYVKPDCGRGGKRVIFIKAQDGGGYEIHYETTATKVEEIAAAAKFVDEIANGDPFIIQQGINLLCIDKAPFDLRVNVQKPYEEWEVTAMIAKMMAPGKVVTNYCQGSTLVEFEQALLRAGLSKAKTNQVKELLTVLGERIANVLNNEYHGLRELGMDIALDSRAEPWILEVNTMPKYPRGLSSKFDRYRQIIRRAYR